MENLIYDELLNAVVNDLKMNGVDGKDFNICYYLWDNECAPFIGCHIAWNTAQGLYEWDNGELEDAIANNDVDEVAKIVTDYIMESYEVECDNDETALDDMVEKCNEYIKDINKQMLFEEMRGWGVTKRVFENFISACDKDFTKYDAIATKYEKKV